MVGGSFSPRSATTCGRRSGWQEGGPNAKKGRRGEGVAQSEMTDRREWGEGEAEARRKREGEVESQGRSKPAPGSNSKRGLPSILMRCRLAVSQHGPMASLRFGFRGGRSLHRASDASLTGSKPQRSKTVMIFPSRREAVGLGQLLRPGRAIRCAARLRRTRRSQAPSSDELVRIYLDTRDAAADDDDDGVRIP